MLKLQLNTKKLKTFFKNHDDAIFTTICKDYSCDDILIYKNNLVFNLGNYNNGFSLIGDGSIEAEELISNAKPLETFLKSCEEETELVCYNYNMVDNKIIAVPMQPIKELDVEGSKASLAWFEDHVYKMSQIINDLLTIEK